MVVGRANRLSKYLTELGFDLCLEKEVGFGEAEGTQHAREENCLQKSGRVKVSLRTDENITNDSGQTRHQRTIKSRLQN